MCMVFKSKQPCKVVFVCHTCTIIFACLQHVGDVQALLLTALTLARIMKLVVPSLNWGTSSWSGELQIILIKIIWLNFTEFLIDLISCYCEVHAVYCGRLRIQSLSQTVGNAIDTQCVYANACCGLEQKLAAQSFVLGMQNTERYCSNKAWAITINCNYG